MYFICTTALILQLTRYFSVVAGAIHEIHNRYEKSWHFRSSLVIPFTRCSYLAVVAIFCVSYTFILPYMINFDDGLLCASHAIFLMGLGLKSPFAISSNTRDEKDNIM